VDELGFGPFGDRITWHSRRRASRG
jgi:hypothetical protein